MNLEVVFLKDLLWFFNGYNNVNIVLILNIKIVIINSVWMFSICVFGFFLVMVLIF